MGINTRAAAPATIVSNPAIRISATLALEPVQPELRPGGSIWRRLRGLLDTYPLHRPDKSVSPPGQRFDVPWSFRRVSQHFANSRDRVVQAVVKIDKGFGRPDLALEALPG